MLKHSSKLALFMAIVLVVQLFLPTVTVLASSELKPPTNVTATEFYPGDVRINWDDVSGANQYRVYQLSEEQELVTEVTRDRAFIRDLSEGTYTFAVTSVSGDKESELSQSVIVNVIYPEMQAPEELYERITNGNDIQLRWNEVDYATEYRIYQWLEGERELLETTSRENQWLRDMPESEYEFEVRSYNERFGESAPSNLSFELVHPEMQPPAGLNERILNGNDIQLRWDEVDYVTEYRIYQRLEGERELLETASRENQWLRDLPEGVYHFEVTSYSDRFGESVPSVLEVDLIHPEMQPPAGLNERILNGNDIQLRWDDADYVTEYHIYQLVEGESKLVATTDRTNYWFRDSAEGEYIYDVRSYSDRFGESVPSSLSIELVHPEMQAPTGLNERLLNGNDIQLRWEEADYATEYHIYQIIEGERELVDTTDRTNHWFRDSAEGEYIFEVTSYSDRFGESEGSRLEIQLIHSEMQAPEGLHERITNGNDIQLRWGEVDYATEYRIYQWIEGERELVEVTDRTNQWFRDLPEGEYHYEVTSYSDRFGESISSTLVIDLIHPEMQAPVGLNERLLNGNDVQLRWNEVDYVTEYRIYQWVDGERELVATIDRTNQWFRDLPEGEYHYEVTSYSDRFGESVSSTLVIDLMHPEMQAPAGLNERILNGNDIQLRWNEADYSTEYHIYQIIDDERKLVATTDRTNQWFRDNIEGEYVFEVTSYSDRFGESVNASRIEVLIDYPEVEAPVIRIGAENENDIRINWNDVTFAEQYNIYELIDGQAVLLGSSDRTNYWIRDIEDGVHDYVVTAVHERFGESDYSNVVTVEFISDFTPPETTSNIVGDWLNEDFNVQLTATDDKSGVAATYYSVNGSEFLEGTNFTVTEEGINEVSYYSIDNAGNVEEINVEYVKIDKAAPETTSNIVGEWLNEDFTVELTATDGKSGVAATYYSVNGSEFLEGTSFTVTEEGINEVSYYSIDNAGNVEEVNVEYVKIDKTAPETTSNIVDEWLNEDFTVELTATDGKSGVAVTYYSINGSEFLEGTSFTVTEEGINEVSYYSIDIAGNVEEVNVEYVKIDKTAPETASNITTEWLKEDYIVELTVTDSKSGVAATYYSVNGSEYTEGTSFVVTEEGKNEVSYYSIDNVGNVEEKTVKYVKIDKTPPTVSLHLKDEYALGTELQLVYEAEDSLSGIKKETLTMNGEVFNNGDVVTLDQPGQYKVKVEVTDHAGWLTTVELEFVVYIPAELDVLPVIIAGNNGVFTVKVNLPKDFHTDQFDLESVTMNGNAAISKNNGHKNQAKRGQFQFNRADFEWNESEKLLEFRGMLGDQLVVAYAIVKVQQNNKRK